MNKSCFSLGRVWTLISRGCGCVRGRPPFSSSSSLVCYARIVIDAPSITSVFVCPSRLSPSSSCLSFFFLSFYVFSLVLSIILLFFFLSFCLFGLSHHSLTLSPSPSVVVWGRLACLLCFLLIYLFCLSVVLAFFSPGQASVYLFMAASNIRIVLLPRRKYWKRDRVV